MSQYKKKARTWRWLEYIE